MNDSRDSKIVSCQEMTDIVAAWKQAGKKVVQSHGVFDIIHPGVIEHFAKAGEKGAQLVVTVIRDHDVRRGPGRPLFPETLRLQNVAALAQVDLVALVDDNPPFSCVRKIRPDVFAQRKALGEFEVHPDIFADGGFGEDIQIVETEGFSLTSTQIVKKLLNIYPESTKSYLADFSERHTFEEIAGYIDKLREMKVLLIGDGIVDEYHYCRSMGRAGKAPLVVYHYLEKEIFAGGAFAVANHLSSFCDQVHLLTVLGKEDSREDFVRSKLGNNVSPNFFYRHDGPTVTKTRFIEQYVNQKAFEVNYLNRENISTELEDEICAHLDEVIAEYDLVLASDFGHGLITEKIIDKLCRGAKTFAVNAQKNSANTGFNLITRYCSPSFICLDEPEARMATQNRFGDVEQLADDLFSRTSPDCMMITLGKNGSIGMNKKGERHQCPVFSTNVVDTVGAGDAFFAFTAPCYATGMPMEILSFLGNAMGALAVQIVCNRRPVERHEILEFIYNLLS